MEQVSENSIAEDGKKKKIVSRSVSYPSFTIEESISFVTTLYKSFAKSTITLDDAIAIVKDTISGSLVNRHISSGVQYGLLLKTRGEGYTITDLFTSLYKSLENEKQQSLFTAFSSPKLYSEIIAAYNNHALPLDSELETVLFRKYHIAEKACKTAAEIFIHNGKYVGAIDDNGILRVDGAPVHIEVDISNQSKPPVTPEKPVIPVTPLKQLNAAPIVEVDEESIKIRVTDKRYVTLIYPVDITKKDILIIRKQLDVLDEYAEN